MLLWSISESLVSRSVHPLVHNVVSTILSSVASPPLLKPHADPAHMNARPVNSVCLFFCLFVCLFVCLIIILLIDCWCTGSRFVPSLYPLYVDLFLRSLRGCLWPSFVCLSVSRPVILFCDECSWGLRLGNSLKKSLFVLLPPDSHFIFHHLHFSFKSPSSLSCPWMTMHFD